MAEHRPPAPYIDVKIDLKNIEQGGIKEILSHVRKDWDLDKVKITNISNGFANQNVTCSYGETMKGAIVMKIFPERTTSLIMDSNITTKAVPFLHETGLSPELICIFKNGVAHAFQMGEVLTWDGFEEYFTNQELSRSTMQTIAEWHSHNVLEVAHKHGFENMDELYILRDAKSMLEKWPPNIDDSRLEQIPPKSVLLQELKELENMVNNLELETVIIHGDLHPANIILREEDKKPVLVDYDTTRLGYAEWDIAYFFQALFLRKPKDECKLLPTKEWHMLSLEDYLEHRRKIDGTKNKVTNEDVERLYVKVRKLSLLYNFYTGFLLFVHAEFPPEVDTEIPFQLDGITLGIDKILKYFEEKEVFLQL